MINARRVSRTTGFTLVEVLAATALLALIASAVVPLMRSLATQSAALRADSPDAPGETGPAPTAARERDLVAVADFLASPEARDLIDWPPAARSELSWAQLLAEASRGDVRLQLSPGAWAQSRSRPRIEIETLVSESQSGAGEQEEGDQRVWIAVRCGDVTVFRPGILAQEARPGAGAAP